MWFKQASLFNLADSVSLSAEDLEGYFEPFAFTPCLPSFPTSFGFAPPIGELAEGIPLVHSANGYLLFCMRCEEKVLPASVVRYEVEERVKAIRDNEDRKVYQKEKANLRDEITASLLPRAFSKYSNVYAFIDPKNKFLILDTTNGTKIEKFLDLFKKAIGETIYSIVETKKIAPILTRWLLYNECPKDFNFEPSGLLRDPNQQTKTVRCNQQDLQAEAICSLLNENYEVQQLSLNWQEKLTFTFSDDFKVKSIRYEDKVLELADDHNAETEEQKFDTNFFIMSQLLSDLWVSLCNLFGDSGLSVKEQLKDESIVA